MSAPKDAAGAHLAAIPERVQRGHRWLTGLDPQRVARVQPERIKIWSNRWCVLGQYAHAAGLTGVNAPYELLDAAGVDPGDGSWLQEHGFACPAGWEHEARYLDLEAYYFRLGDEWVRVLTHEPTVVLDTTSGHR